MKVPVKFENDMTTLRSADGTFNLLVHLGYLTYDFYTGQVWIPNSEVAQEFINSIEDAIWSQLDILVEQNRCPPLKARSYGLFCHLRGEKFRCKTIDAFLIYK